MYGGCLPVDFEALQLHRVEWVYDGDTLRTEGGEKVRLIGLNAPEMGREGRPAQPLAGEASRRLEALLGGERQIFLKPGAESRDRYGRLLAYGFNRQGVNLAARLVTEGLAFAVVIPPNLWNSGCVVEQQHSAEAVRRGLWGHPAYQAKPLEQIDSGGFQRIRGRVERVDWSRRWLWLDMAHQVSVQIARGDLPHFKGVLDLERLAGETITVQGWLVTRKKGYRVRLHHPSAIKVE